MKKTQLAPPVTRRDLTKMEPAIPACFGLALLAARMTATSAILNTLRLQMLDPSGAKRESMKARIISDLPHSRQKTTSASAQNKVRLSNIPHLPELHPSGFLQKPCFEVPNDDWVLIVSLLCPSSERSTQLFRIALEIKLLSL